MKLWFLIAVQFLKRHKAVFSLLFLVLISVIFLQVKFKLFFNQNIISLGLIGTYQEHDLPVEVTKFLSQGLVQTDDNGHIRPKLVTGWETNNDATDFKFKLKDNLKWVDGTAIKSADLAFAIPNLEISYPDDKTVQLKLKESYSPLPSLLTKPIFKKGTLLGTGPYKLAKIEKSRIFITKIELMPMDENLPKIYIRFYPTENVAVTGFNLGEVQALLGFSNAKTFSKYPNVQLKQTTDYTKIVCVLLGVKDNVLSNRSLRQALAFATPKISTEEVANNPYPPFLWAYNNEAKKYLDNPEEAKSAMERAKANMSDEQFKEDLILTATPNLEEVGKAIIDAWKNLNLNAKLRVEPGIAQNFQALLITQSIPIDPDQYFLWHATQTKTNLTKYDSKRADKDLEDGRKLIPEEDRKAKYYDFQKTLLEDAPAIFLYFPKYNIAYLKKSEKLLNNILNLQ